MTLSPQRLEKAAKIKVTPSCGCVFCDVGLKPHEDGIHRANGYEVECKLMLSAELTERDAG